MARADRGPAMRGLLTGWLLFTSVLWPLAGQCAAAPDPTLFSFQERPGAQLPERSLFRDSDGHSVRLGELSHGRPLIVILAYYGCSSLCPLVRSSLFNALHAAHLTAGRDYALAVLSIDPYDGSAQARITKTADLSAFGLLQSERYIHYLTGDAKDIQAITDTVGFRDRFDPASNQFVHPAGVVFVSSSGRVSNYLLGVGYTPAAVRSALERAAEDRIVAAASPLLLICFHFDSTSGRYSLEILKVLRLAAIVAVLTLAGLLWLLHRRERRTL